MKKRALSQQGFTIIELLVFLLVISIVGVVALTNIRTLRAQNRDASRKTDINAVYYQLEAFHEQYAYYPETISTEILRGIDPESLKDTDGLAPNTTGSYTYEPLRCEATKCGSFKLSARLEREATFVKQSLN